MILLGQIPISGTMQQRGLPQKSKDSPNHGVNKSRRQSLANACIQIVCFTKTWNEILKVSGKQHKCPQEQEEEPCVEEKAERCRTASFARNGHKAAECFLHQLVRLRIRNQEKDQCCIQGILRFQSKVYAVVGRFCVA